MAHTCLDASTHIGMYICAHTDMINHKINDVM